MLGGMCPEQTATPQLCYCLESASIPSFQPSPSNICSLIDMRHSAPRLWPSSPPSLNLTSAQPNAQLSPKEIESSSKTQFQNCGLQLVRYNIQPRTASHMSFKLTQVKRQDAASSFCAGSTNHSRPLHQLRQKKISQLLQLRQKKISTR